MLAVNVVHNVSAQKLWGRIEKYSSDKAPIFSLYLNKSYPQDSRFTGLLGLMDNRLAIYVSAQIRLSPLWHASANATHGMVAVG